jgi:hypothetical protein
MTRALVRKIAVLAAIAGLVVSVAGCVSDAVTPVSAQSSDTQLRYYGGPKYPMWPAQ